MYQINHFLYTLVQSGSTIQIKNNIVPDHWTDQGGDILIEKITTFYSNEKIYDIYTVQIPESLFLAKGTTIAFKEPHFPK